MNKIQKAYSIIGDEKERKRYDLYRSQGLNISYDDWKDLKAPLVVRICIIFLTLEGVWLSNNDFFKRHTGIIPKNNKIYYLKMTKKKKLIMRAKMTYLRNFEIMRYRIILIINSIPWCYRNMCDHYSNLEYYWLSNNKPWQVIFHHKMKLNYLNIVFLAPQIFFFQNRHLSKEAKYKVQFNFHIKVQLIRNLSACQSHYKIVFNRFGYDP